METHFRGGAEAPELEGYRPVSPLVIVACLAALASALALAHPLLWVVPAVAVVLSVCAIAGVSAAQSRYSGRSAAVAALCLAALLGSYAPARVLSRDRALNETARGKIVEWIALVQQGRVQEAHQLTMKSGDRFQGPKSLASYYANDRPSQPSYTPTHELPESSMGGPSPAQNLAQFVAAPVIAKLMEYGSQSRVEHLQNVAVQLVHGELRITQRYRVNGIHDGQPGSVEFLITATRQASGKLASWNVGDLRFEK